MPHELQEIGPESLAHPPLRHRKGGHRVEQDQQQRDKDHGQDETEGGQCIPVALHTAALCLRRRIEMDLFGDVPPEEGTGDDGDGDAQNGAQQDHPSQLGVDDVGHGHGTRRGGNEAVGHRQTCQQGDGVVEQRPLAVARQGIDDGYQDDEAHIEEYRDSHQEPGEGHRPGGPPDAETADQMVRQ